MTANPIVCMPCFLGTYQCLLVQGCQPRLPQGQGLDVQGTVPWKDQQVVAWRQLPANLSGQLTKEALGTITRDGSPQTFAYNHAHSRMRHVGTTGHEVKQRGGKPSAGFFDALDVAALFEK